MGSDQANEEYQIQPTMKILFILLLVLISGIAIEQKGQVSQVRSSRIIRNDNLKNITCKFTKKINKVENDHDLKIKCKFTIKINDIENDTLSFVSIQIDADNLSSNNGNIYLSSENELNEFVEELKQGISKLKAIELFKFSNSRYILSVVADSVTVRNSFTKTIFAPKFRMRMQEVRSGSSKIFLSFYSDDADKLLAWLEGIKF